MEKLEYMQSTDISLLKKQDSEAFERLYDSYSPVLYGFILRIVRDEIVARKVCLDTFCKVRDEISKFDSSKATFLIWLITIARQEAFDAVSVDKRGGTGTAGQIDYNIRANQNEELSRNDGLKDKDMLDRMLCFGKSRSCFSEEYNMPVTTVSQRLRVALKQFRVPPDKTSM